MSVANQYLLDQFRSVAAFCELLRQFCERGENLERLVDDHISKYGMMVGKGEEKRNRLLLGEISPKDLTFLLFELSERLGGERIMNNSVFVRVVIERLREHFLIIDSIVPGLPDYRVNTELFPVFWNFGLLEHAIFGPSYSIERMRRSVPFVEVTKSNGDIGLGTGFVVCTGNCDDDISQHVVTNRHVVEEAEIERISAHDVDFNLTSEPVLCEYADLAMLPIDTKDQVQSFLLNSKPSLLADVIAVGYPKVAQTRAPALLAHKGEINGEVEAYNGERLLVVSCHVNPGNSGGPLIDSVGRCCGVVTRSHSSVFQESAVKDGQMTATYNMAIPASVVEKFVLESTGGAFRAQPTVLTVQSMMEAHNDSLQPTVAAPAQP